MEVALSLNYEWVIAELHRFVEMCEREKYTVPPSTHPRYGFLVPEDNLAKQAAIVRLALSTVFPEGQFDGRGYGSFSTEMLKAQAL